MRMRLNKTNVDKLQPKAKRYDVTDDQIRGLRCRVNANGTKSMVLRYRSGNRYQSFKLGVLGGDFTVAQARRRAAQIRATVDAGQDPARERERERKGVTFGEAAEQFMREAKARCKPTTLASHRCLLRAHLLPAFGSTKIVHVQRADVAALNTKIGETTPVTANRARSLLSLIFAAAETWGMRTEGTNPCRGIRGFREKMRKRTLTGVERARLEVALREAEGVRKGHPLYIGPAAITAFRLLLLTGARRNEICQLRWDEVDLDSGCLRKIDTKTGAREILLSKRAIELLRSLEAQREDGIPWVCANSEGRYLQNLTRTWVGLRKRIDLDDVTIHDFRRSFATDALNATVPMPMVSAMLGHTSIASTARYAHPITATVREALETTDDAMAVKTREGAERLRREHERRVYGVASGDAVMVGGGDDDGEGGATIIPLRR